VFCRLSDVFVLESARESSDVALVRLKASAAAHGDFEQWGRLGCCGLSGRTPSSGAAIRQKIHAQSRREVSIKFRRHHNSIGWKAGLLECWIAAGRAYVESTA